jgi:hypothetical protein
MPRECHAHAAEAIPFGDGHEGWLLPRVACRHTDGRIDIAEPSVTGEPVSAFVTSMLDRLLCFVEEFTAHCLQARMLAGITLTEIPLSDRDPLLPARFRITLIAGGLPPWRLAFHTSTFEDT